MGTIRNILRTDKPLKTGKCPVDLICQVSGQRKFYRTDLKLYPQSWDAEKQKAVYLDKKQAKKLLSTLDYDLLPTFREVEDANASLFNLAAAIGDIEKRYKMDKIPFSSEMVIEKLKAEAKGTTKKEQKSNVLFEFMQKYIDDHKNSRARTSLSVYKSVKNHLENFCKSTGRKVTFDNIDYSFFQSFQNFLLQDQKVSKNVDGEMKEVIVKGLNNTTVAKQLSTIKTFLNYAKTQGVQVSDKYKDFKIKRENLESLPLPVKSLKLFIISTFQVTNA